MDDRWKGWIKENMQRGCNPKDLQAILLKNKFNAEEIDAELELYQPSDERTEIINFKALASVRVTRNPKAKKVKIDTAQIYVLEDFMTTAECQELIDISREQLQPSTISTQETEPDKYFRTSSTCYLSQTKAPLAAEIDQRIAETVGINPIYSEGIQIQRYEVGQEFKAHTDYFQPGTKEYEKYCRVQGNRTWTMMVYLNDTPKGGGTQFTKLDLTFYPKTGTALIWNNLQEDGRPNSFTKHWGLPVEDGHKVIITKWFREIGKGKMIMD
ncbi:MAG: prolyl hydroxylase family protein [Rickettsiales bacterium]